MYYTRKITDCMFCVECEMVHVSYLVWLDAEANLKRAMKIADEAFELWVKDEDGTSYPQGYIGVVSEALYKERIGAEFYDRIDELDD